LRQLTVFEAVARTGSIVKAADEIGLSQSAASMSLKDLEAHLQVELFARQGKKLVLSDYGRLLRVKVKSILQQADEIESLITPDNLRGRLRIGATPPIGDYVLPAMCADFMRLHPDVVIDLTIGSSMDVMHRLQRMSIDVGFIGSPCNSSDLETLQWMEDPLVVFCSPTHELANCGEVSIVDLQNESWLMEQPLSSERTSFTVEILKYLTSLRVTFEADDIEAVKRMAKLGAGIGCASRVVIEDELKRGELRIIDVRELKFTRIFSICFRRELHRGFVLSAFVDFVQQGQRRARTA